MANFKWADVAHMYLKSGIEGMATNGYIKKKFATKVLMGINDVTEYPKREFTPILRHRDDLTEGERNAHFERLAQFYADGLNVPIGWEAHSLISMGVDVFGLIESGEAIRKEVGNA